MIQQRTLRAADLFCGAGGTSTGLINACREAGRPVELTAINHWQTAVNTHSLNHPNVRHLCASLDSLNPRDLFAVGELDILWASPECTHHSTARGGKPINEQSRATAWCVTRWAEALLPKAILVENVPEFVTWGPIGSNGRPLKSRQGETFRAWVATLESLGYTVGTRTLCSADYGDPTTRRRLFVQAVRGRRKPTWPDPTHAKPSESEDLSGSRKPWVAAREIIDWSMPGESIYERKRPLSPKTMRRIWAGLKKFGLEPSIITMEHGGRLRSADQPLPTITTARGGAMAVSQPFLVSLRGSTDAHLDSSASGLDDPIRAITASGTHHALVEPFIVHTAHAGQRRAYMPDEPLPTVAGNRGDLALIEPHILPQHSGGILRPVSQPVPTVTTTSRGIALVQPFLVNYYGTGHADSIDEPLATVTAKHRHALVKPVVEIKGERYQLDIRFRMLQPAELAAAQGFPKGYRFSGTKTDQVKQIGNAVTCNLAKAIVGTFVENI